MPDEDAEKISDPLTPDGPQMDHSYVNKADNREQHRVPDTARRDRQNERIDPCKPLEALSVSAYIGSHFRRAIFDEASADPHRKSRDLFDIPPPINQAIFSAVIFS